MNSFKNRNSFRDRKNDCIRILTKYPDRIPIICEKCPYSRGAPEIDKHKYLAGYDLTVGQFMLVIRKRMCIRPEIGLYIFVNGIIPSNSSFLRNLYSDFKDDDGFLYITYDIENTFGNNYFEKGDIIYLLKNNEPEKSETYIIDKIETIKGGNWHDGFDELHYAYLENSKT
jgi:GABA(A) receptor-associated protein